MNADERSAAAMHSTFRDAHFDPSAYALMEKVMAKAIRGALIHERIAIDQLIRSMAGVHTIEEICQAILARRS